MPESRIGTADPRVANAMGRAHRAKSDAEVLREAKALIAHPNRWSKQSYFRRGRMCATGALGMVLSGVPGGGAVGTPAYRLLAKASGVPMVNAYNDTHTHREVMVMFDRAIALAEAKAASTATEGPQDER